MRSILMSCTAAAMAFAAEPTARLSTPVLGYVFDSSAKALRAIAGVPGAASVEAALPSASKLQIGFVSPNREWLLAVLLEGGVEIVNLRSGTTTTLEGVPQDAMLGAWSADGTALAIWGRSGILQVWEGLLGRWKHRFSQSVESVNGLAVADSGDSALVWSDAGLFSVDAQEARQLSSEPTLAATYRASSSEWAAVSATQVFGSGTEARALNVESPTAVAFTKQGLLVGGKGAIEAVSDSGSSDMIACECEATALAPLAGRDVFRLTGLNASAVAIYDGSESEPRILYIPNEGGRQ